MKINPNHKLKCLNCKIKIKAPRRKFCSDLCSERYWNKKNHDYIKTWREKNSEHVKKYTKLYHEKWREENPEKWKASQKNWKVKNPEKWKALQKKKHKVELKDIIKHSARKYDYLKRDKKCKYCRATKNLEFHHTNYKTKEGITLCIPCHKKVHMELNRKEGK